VLFEAAAVAGDNNGNLVVTELKDGGVQTQEHLLEDQLGCGLVNIDGDEISSHLQNEEFERGS
jgi:hypothetical protein